MNLENLTGFKAGRLTRPWKVGVGLFILGLAPLLQVLKWMEVS